MQTILKNFFSSNKPTRLSTLSRLEASDLAYFKQFLSESEIVADPQQLATFNQDWMKKYKGHSKLALIPNTTAKIQQILKYCNERKLAVVPQSGNTGLVGGSVPVFDEIVLSLQKLNKVDKFNPNTNVVTTESGVILENLNNYLKPYNCEVPLDLGAKGSCFIGGNVATHAGGKYFIKYGPLRGNILGMECVLANGTLLDLGSEIKKDNTGFDLKQLFIGSEGLLGIITKLNILCPKIEKHKKLFLLKTSSYQNVLSILNLSKHVLGKNLASIEYMDGYCYDLVQKNIPNITNPFSSKNLPQKHFYVWIQIDCSHSPEELCEALYGALDKDSLVEDSVMAENETQFNQIWLIRELSAPATLPVGPVFKYDISLDVSLMNSITEEMRQKMGDLAYSIGYGHIGDGNLHLNVCCYDEKNYQKVENIIEPYIFHYLRKVKGSISAEHGLGIMKNEYLGLQKDKTVIEFMQKIKDLYDPNHILNPYKVL